MKFIFGLISQYVIIVYADCHMPTPTLLLYSDLGQTVKKKIVSTLSEYQHNMQNILNFKLKS